MLLLSSFVSFRSVGEGEGEGAGTPVSIPDAGLESALRTAISKPTGPLLDSELASITSLEASGLSIQTIEGLQHCVGLESLNLSSNAIIDITPLASLTGLQRLYLFNNDFISIEPLSSLLNLTILDIGYNEVTDAAPLASLVALEDLRAARINITDFSPIGALPALKSLSLASYETGGAVNLAFLQNLGNLESLFLSEFTIANLDVVANLDSLTVLALDSVTVSSLSPLGTMTGIVNLTLINSGIADISALGTMTGLKHLDLTSNQVTDISPLGTLTGLESLTLSSQDSTAWDLSVLSSLPLLMSLSIQNAGLTDATAAPLVDLTSLTSLNLGANQLTDVDFLSSLTNLYNLNLSGNQIRVISAIASLANLNSLYLSYNQVCDISALVANAGLGEFDLIYIDENFLDAESCATHIPALQARGANVVDFGSCTGGGIASCDGPAIPDEALLQALRDALGWNGEPTPTMLASLTQLNLSNAGIASLEGLQYCTGLISLTLSGNTLQDVDALGSLSQLRFLTMENCGLNSIAFASTLQALEQMSIKDNQVSDLTPLSALPALSHVNCENNAVTNLLPFILNANLDSFSDSVYVGGNPLSRSTCRDQVPYLSSRILLYSSTICEPIEVPDLSLALSIKSSLLMNPDDELIAADLAGLQTLTTYCYGDGFHTPYTCVPPVQDLTGLELCTSLRVFDMDISAGVDLTPLSQLTTLRTIKGLTQVSSLDFVAPLTELQVLDVIGTVSDLSPLTALSDLRELEITPATTGGDVADLADLAGLVELRKVVLPGHAITDVTPLGTLIKLTHLNLRDNQIEDISPLSGLVQLVNLYLGDNGIVNLSPITSLANISVLNVENNAIAVLPSLQAMGGLTGLDLSGNSLTGIAAVNGLSELGTLDVSQNFLTSLDGIEGTASLRNLSAADNDISDITALEDLDIINLDVSKNNLADITTLGSLPLLVDLDLSDNPISDCAALVNNAGIDQDDIVNLSRTDLDVGACDEEVPALLDRGVVVEYFETCGGVYIPDEGLRAALAYALGGQSALTPAELASITTLSLSTCFGFGCPPSWLVNSLDGIEHLQGLESLYISGQPPLDFDVLGQLTSLQSVDIFAEGGSIDFLASLPNLNFVRLSLPIADLAPLVNNPGFGMFDALELYGQVFDAEVCDIQIPALQDRGVAISGDFECVPAQSEQIWVSVEGDDLTGLGTPANPLRTIQHALDFAGGYATSVAPITVRVGPGVYEEVLQFPPHVHLLGYVDTQADLEAEPEITVISPPETALLEANLIGIELAENTSLRDVTVQLDLDVAAQGVTLVLLRGVEAQVDNVVFDGRSRFQSVGIQALNPDSSGSNITRCTFRRLAFGVRAIDTAINISRNRFEIIEEDAVVVALPDEKGDAGLTPALGLAGNDSTTGYNIFESVTEKFVNSLSTEFTIAQNNDWGVYTAEEIGARMSQLPVPEGESAGSNVVFEPFKGAGSVESQPMVDVTVQDAEVGVPIYNASVQLQPFSFEVTRNVNGVYTFPLVTPGNYTVVASAPGYEGATIPLNVPAASASILPVTVVLQGNDVPTPEPAIRHNADSNRNGRLDLTELLRGIQLYNVSGFGCFPGTEDGFGVGVADRTCIPHAADINPTDWRLSLSEFLRLVQFFGMGGYHRCESGEGGYCAGPAA